VIGRALEALAGRVEALAGPDRVVDIAIGSLLGLCPHESLTYERCQGDSGHTCNACGADSWGNRNKAGQRLSDPLPFYTASLDAVRSMIDPTDEWDLTTLYNIARASVGLNRDQQTSWTGHGEHLGCDPVLALLAGALRARARQAPAAAGG
jgi:hypothetical protein